MNVVATRTIWRYLRNSKVIETTEAGERCDWAANNHTYITLGWVVPA